MDRDDCCASYHEGHKGKDPKGFSLGSMVSFVLKFAPIVLSLMTLPALTSGTRAQVGLSESRTPTPTAIEQALMEHACSKTPPTGAAGTDPYRECLSAQLNSLRADFGRDLNRLSVSERKTLDSACSSTLTAVGREAYLECLGAQLVSLRNRRSRANPVASEASALPLPSESVPTISLVAPALETSSKFSGLWIGIALGTLFVAAGGALLAVKARRTAAPKCRVCGGDAPGGGDLCPKCRHEAADALRHAAIERVDHERAQEEERRQQSERADAYRQRNAHQEEEARQRQQEEAGQREENARRRQKEEEESRQRNRAGVDIERVFDPYAVLSVPQDASKDAIETAYEEAMLKYAPEQVAHLGAELQEHYKRKAEAVDRAYTILTK